MRSKVMSYLGFAAKAGKIVNGYNTCMFMMEKKKVKLVILANDLAENSIKKMISLAGRYRVPYSIFGTMEDLSHMTGTVGKGIFAITDTNFAEVILKEIDDMQSSEKEVF